MSVQLEMTTVITKLHATIMSVLFIVLVTPATQEMANIVKVHCMFKVPMKQIFLLHYVKELLKL